MTAKTAISLATVALVFIPRPTLAQTAEQIIDRYVAAIGGRDALAAVASMRYVRTVLNTQDGVTAEQSRKTIYRKRPYFYRTEDLNTGRVYVSDGRKAWTGRSAADSESLIWEEAAFVLRSRDLDFDRLFGSFVNFAMKGHSAEFVGNLELEGVQLDVVRVTWREGDQWDFYFAPSTRLCYGFTSNPGEPNHLTRVGDYRRVGGILVPHRNTSIDRTSEGNERVHERLYTDIVFEVVFSDSLFRPAVR